ncbi:MAG TPA: PAS domain-containing protein [Polyangiales bacterium]|nr:PAS domain-containing protein [Polyangiales bacterium]
MEANTLTASTYMAALGAASDGVLMIDREGVILYANPAAESFFCDEGLQGQFVADLTPLDRRTLSGVFRALRRTRRWSGRLCVRSASPELDVTVQRVASDPNDTRREDHYCVILHGAARIAQQLTEGPRHEQAEKPSTLQRVASEIAHDFNNQIAVILNYTFVLLRHMPDGSPLKAHVAEMQAAAWRASHVAQAIHRALVTPQQAALSSGE